MKAVCKSRVKYNGTYYKKGDVIDIEDEKELERLAKLDVISEYTEPEKKQVKQKKKEEGVQTGNGQWAWKTI